MKRVTASEARTGWFRLLDEVVAGEIVCVKRGGFRVLIQRQFEAAPDADLPDYGRILRVPEFEPVTIDPETRAPVWPGGLDVAPDALYSEIVRALQTS